MSDSVVPRQGVSYQAAQWLEETLAMAAIGADSPGLPISASVEVLEVEEGGVPDVR